MSTPPSAREQGEPESVTGVTEPTSAPATDPNPVWSEERLRAMLSEHEFGYQRIELPFGLDTGGNDRSPVARYVFPDDMSGKSVFDLGCRDGYFCFEAERRGATHVVGGELDPNSLARCELLADVLKSKAQFLKFDIETEPLPGHFDFVLCLNVLHHLRNPLSTLDKLIEMTRERLVLEIASLTPKDRRGESLATRLFGGLLNLLPILYVGGSGAMNLSGRSYFITERAIVAMLSKHRRDIARVDIAHVEREKRGRYLAIAHKRRIGHLVIVMGTNASGKSTFVERLLSGDDPQLAARLGMNLSDGWRHQRYNKLAADAEPVVPRMLIQFNVGKYLIDGDLHHPEKCMGDLIRCADRVTIATVWVEPEELRERFAKRVPTSWLRKRLRSRRTRKIHKVFTNLYSRPGQLASMYRDWFAFARAHTDDNHVVVQRDGYQFITIDDWESRQKAGT